jgi:hypothetical protein
LTQLFVNVSWGYLRYGPYPKDASISVLVAFSSITILLACIALFDALRSSAPRWVATVLLAPLALFALMHLAQVVSYGLGYLTMTPMGVFSLGVYFRPQLLVRQIAGVPMGWMAPDWTLGDSFVEGAKWCIMLVIAVWLSTSQLAAWWQAKKALAVVRRAGLSA